eukprot:12911222-Prorocentrum_lima.AAC.1
MSGSSACSHSSSSCFCNAVRASEQRRRKARQLSQPAPLRVMRTLANAGQEPRPRPLWRYAIAGHGLARLLRRLHAPL